MVLRIREVRQAKGITQTFMAKKLGFRSVSGYNAIERGLRRLDIERASQIADILEVGISDLFFDENLPELCKRQSV